MRSIMPTVRPWFMQLPTPASRARRSQSLFTATGCVLASSNAGVHNCLTKMPPKPKDKALEAELVETVRRVYNSSERDQLTVNYARQIAEKRLKLVAGFFKEGEWKERSKQIIHGALVSNPWYRKARSLDRLQTGVADLFSFCGIG